MDYLHHDEGHLKCYVTTEQHSTDTYAPSKNHAQQPEIPSSTAALHPLHDNNAAVVPSQDHK